MPVNDAKLDETLNITPTEVSNTPEGGCAKREDQLTDVTNVGITKPDRLLKDDIDDKLIKYDNYFYEDFLLLCEPLKLKDK